MELVAAKSINISKLLVLCPPGTLDPTPHLYDSTMYTLSGLMAVAVVAHGLVKPVTPPASYGNQAGAVIDTTGTVVSSNVPTSETAVGDRLVK